MKSVYVKKNNVVLSNASFKNKNRLTKKLYSKYFFYASILLKKNTPEASRVFSTEIKTSL